MNIKTGQILKYKEDINGTRKVLAVLENNALLSCIEDHEASGSWSTFKEIEKWYLLPKEKWVPEEGQEYWFIGDDGLVSSCDWCDDEVDEDRLKFNNVFQTAKEAQEALEKVKEVLRK